jgi:heptosyltransferase-1
MKIAIVKLSAMGDIVHALVALQFLKAALPTLQIDWIVEERFAELLRHNPDIDHILTVNLKALKNHKAGIFGQLKTIRGYAANGYDVVIDAQGLLKSALTAKLLGKRVAGFDADSIREPAASWFYSVKIACPYDANTIDRNAAVLSQPLGLHISHEQILNKQPFLFFQNADPRLDDFLSHQRKNIVLVIGSTWESRNYPPEKFVAVAEQLQQNCLVVWASAAEKTAADWMAAQSGGIRVLPKLDLNSLKAVIAHADLVIGNDTGPTHIAWGLNRPSITLFGCTPVSRIYQTDINKAVKSASVVNPHQLNKQDFSIRDIDVQSVVELARTLLL